MTDTPSPNLRLFGTEEPAAPCRVLRAGPLSAELEDGNLRHIRFAGHEMIRAVSCIIRDRNWGTYGPEITDLAIEENADRFRVTYAARIADHAQALRYTAAIEGDASGRLRFACRGEAESDFVTNRAGFVVLHPVDGVAGEPARIETVDGKQQDTQFPALIDPVQPMRDLRAITHDFAPGASVTCRMEGDTFEMEDQRNWTDASFKTYVRPLALPWPYTLPAGSKLEQSVTLAVQGRPDRPLGAGGAVSVRIGAPAGRMPALGLGLDPAETDAALTRLDALRAIRPAHVLIRHDPRRGHDRASLEQCLAVVRGLGAVPWLEAVLVSVEGYAAEIAALGETARALGNPFAAVIVSPASDLKSTLPGTTWPPAPPALEMDRAVRRAFPAARIGGGMLSYFTELNRKRPPVEALDFVSFTTSPLVHAGDDRTVMESLEALPWIVRSLRGFIGETPYAVGPSGIVMRDNPYGAAPAENPNNRRQAMNRVDPRQRGLLGAAWALGYFAHFAQGGAKAVALGGLVGPAGAVHAPMAWEQPWYDVHGGLFPVFHVLRGLARLRDSGRREVAVSAPGTVQAVATGDAVWLANLTGEAVRISLDPRPKDAGIAVLDAARFVEAAADPDIMAARRPLGGGEIELDAYAVAAVG